jgi:transposase
MTLQKKDTKSSKKAQSSFIELLKKNKKYQKKVAAKQKKIRKLGYLDLGEKRQILCLTNLDFSPEDIGALGCSKRTVYRTLKRFQTSGNLAVKPKSGRSRNATPAIDIEIKRLCNEDRSRTSGQILAMLKENHPDLKLSERTVRERLVSFGLFGRVASRKPLLRDANKQKRLVFALKHEHWEPEDRAKVLCTDEKKFELFNSKRRKYLRRKKAQTNQ